MAQAVYRRNGMLFRAFIEITANPNDTVTVIGPKDYEESFLVGNSGKITVTVKSKGSYTVSGETSLQTVMIAVEKSRQTYYANVSFNTIFVIKGNANDTVNISGPNDYSESVTLNSSGSASNVTVPYPGNYTFSGEESNVSTTITASKGQTLNANVVFSCLVKVTANPSAKITLSTTSGISRSYSATANASTGIADVTVYRKAKYSISTSTSSSGSVLSTSPASVSEIDIQNTTAKTAVHVRVYSTPGLSTGTWSSRVGYVYYAASAISDGRFTGMYIRWKIDNYPSSLSDGTVLADGVGSSLAISSGTNRIGFTTPTFTVNRTYYYRGAAYVTINGIKYFGNNQTSYWRCVEVTSGSSGKSVGSGTWTVPEGVRRITVFCVGGGGAGGSGGSYSYSSSSGSLYSYGYGGGGGGGGYCSSGSLNVTPGQRATVTVGPGGSSPSARGGNTRFLLGSFDLNAGGGYGGGGCPSDRSYGYNSDVSKQYGGGGSGGAGGGAGGYYHKPAGNSPYVIGGGNGGSDGGNGSSATGYDLLNNRSITCGSSYGTGAGASKVTFNSTVYSGGGGGGGHSNSSPAVTGYGSGGNRGGARGAYQDDNAGNATNGGGGGGGGGYASKTPSNGGSGAVIIVW